MWKRWKHVSGTNIDVQEPPLQLLLTTDNDEVFNKKYIKYEPIFTKLVINGHTFSYMDLYAHYLTLSVYYANFLATNT